MTISETALGFFLLVFLDVKKILNKFVKKKYNKRFRNIYRFCFHKDTVTRKSIRTAQSSWRS